MGKGSPIVQIRVPPLYLAALDDAIRHSNRLRRKDFHTRSSFLLSAMMAKISQQHRSKKCQEKRKASGKHKITSGQDQMA
jgi:hypothetical protein